MINKTPLTVNLDTGGYMNSGYIFGLFFLYNQDTGMSPSNNYHSCRETFRNELNQNNNFETYDKIGFVTNPAIDIKSLNKFWAEIEKLLKIKDKTIFYATNFPKVIIVKPSKFWWKTDTYRSFFSLFLRAFGTYTQPGDNDIYTVLNRYDLAVRIMPAIRWFLAGNIVPIYQDLGRGVVDKFTNITDEVRLRELLIEKRP